MAMHYTDVVGFYGGFPIPILVGPSETGKSLSSDCALAIFGQHNAGHIMKTKSTSNTICFERCTQSSLPFVLDDPKSADDIGEMLINFCDGRSTGKSKLIFVLVLILCHRKYESWT